MPKRTMYDLLDVCGDDAELKAWIRRYYEQKETCCACLWQEDWNDPSGRWCYKHPKYVQNCRQFVNAVEYHLRDEKEERELAQRMDAQDIQQEMEAVERFGQRRFIDMEEAL